jgi:hypothetical protein
VAIATKKLQRAVPSGLAHRRGRPGAAEWLAALPRLAAECAERWGLEADRAHPLHLACAEWLAEA